MTRAALVLAFGLAACGGGGEYLGTREPATGPEPLDPPAFLLGFAERHTNALHAPERSIDELEEAVQTERGDSRRQAARALAVAHLRAAEETEGRDQARHRRAALRWARRAARGSRDDWLKAEMAFVEVWSAWRAERGGASNVAERFARRHARSGDLVLLSWIIRGEIAFERERWDEATAAYRYVLGSLDHPLYGYALYRTAHAWRAQERGEEADQALREVVLLGCSDEAADETRRVAAAAQADLRMPDVTLEDGTTRPQACVDR